MIAWNSTGTPFCPVLMLLPRVTEVPAEALHGDAVHADVAPEGVTEGVANVGAVVVPGASRMDVNRFPVDPPTLNVVVVVAG